MKDALTISISAEAVISGVYDLDDTQLTVQYPKGQDDFFSVGDEIVVYYEDGGTSEDVIAAMDEENSTITLTTGLTQDDPVTLKMPLKMCFLELDLTPVVTDDTEQEAEENVARVPIYNAPRVNTEWISFSATITLNGVSAGVSRTPDPEEPFDPDYYETMNSFIEKLPLFIGRGLRVETPGDHFLSIDRAYLVNNEINITSLSQDKFYVTLDFVGYSYSLIEGEQAPIPIYAFNPVAAEQNVLPPPEPPVYGITTGADNFRYNIGGSTGTVSVTVDGVNQTEIMSAGFSASVSGFNTAAMTLCVLLDYAAYGTVAPARLRVCGIGSWRVDLQLVSGTLYLEIGSTGGYRRYNLPGGLAPPFGGYKQLLVTISGTTITPYIDGVALTLNTNIGTLPSHTTHMFAISMFLYGDMKWDNVILWDKVLDSTERDAIFNAPYTPSNFIVSSNVKHYAYVEEGVTPEYPTL